MTIAQFYRAMEEARTKLYSAVSFYENAKRTGSAESAWRVVIQASRAMQAARNAYADALKRTKQHRSAAE